ncbi:HPP family protein [Ruminococcaceae bacterium OttesenSCG-928-L11]|nr:HPP family protein [Ruminococcaceae bacterium OttesenSCG-928-L11]
MPLKALRLFQKTTTPLQREHPRQYRLRMIAQCLVAGLFILAVYLVADALGSGLVGASIGASTFIAFAYPQAESSHPRYMIGGYATSILAGAVCSGLLSLLGGAGAAFPLHAVLCALAVFLTVFCMVLLDFQHPPAAALAIFITESSSPLVAGLFSLVAVVLLCLLKRAMKKILVNL